MFPRPRNPRRVALDDRRRGRGIEEVPPRREELARPPEESALLAASDADEWPPAVREAPVHPPRVHVFFAVGCGRLQEVRARVEAEAIEEARWEHAAVTGERREDVRL